MGISLDISRGNIYRGIFCCWIPGNHVFYHQIQGFPVNFPIIQFYEAIDLAMQNI